MPEPIITPGQLYHKNDHCQQYPVNKIHLPVKPKAIAIKNRTLRLRKVLLLLSILTTQFNDPIAILKLFSETKAALT